MEKYLEKLYKDDKESFYKLVANNLKKEKKQFIITVNPESLIMAQKDKDIDAILTDKDNTLVADGIAVVKAAKWLKNPVKERITGVDLMEFLLRDANKNHYSLYLFGAQGEVVKKMSKRIKKEYPNIKLLGATDGYVQDKDKVMKKIAKLEPDICLLALGIPAQELLIAKHIKEFKKGIFVGVGGSFDVFSGTKKRAPKIFIKLNLEWLYRIASEPKRLKRFWQYNIKFLMQVFHCRIKK